jgi:hypothetical protein
MSSLHEVRRVIARRKQRGKVEYRVRWRGFDPRDDTWEPLGNLYTDHGLHADIAREIAALDRDAGDVWQFPGGSAVAEAMSGDFYDSDEAGEADEQEDDVEELERRTSNRLLNPPDHLYPYSDSGSESSSEEEPEGMCPVIAGQARDGRNAMARFHSLFRFQV